MSFRILSKQSKTAAAFAITFLVLILIPLFAIAHFNYPCTDDFADGYALYRGIRDGSSFSVIVRGAWELAVWYYENWQGRYFECVLATFGIGIAIPKYYFLGTYLVLTLFVTANISFFRTLTYRICRWDSDISWICCALIVAMQVLYVPHPSEAFFWYVGSTGYTMAHALMLFLGKALISFYSTDDNKIRILAGGASLLLAVMVGGSNYATSLLTAELLVLALAGMLFKKKKCFFLGIITIEYLICFVKFNALAPGNATRMAATKGMGVTESILASLRQGGLFLREWFHLPIVLFLTVVFLLGASQIAGMKFSFRLPGLITVVSFGLFCSMMTPAYFAASSRGPARLVNLVYFAYYILLAGNLLYWTGWATHKYEKFRLAAMKEIKPLPVILCFCVLFVVCLKIYGLQSTNSSSAFLSLVKGEAATYLKENEARWEIYTDESVKNMVVEDFSVKPRVLYTDDIVENEKDWRNHSICVFFGKETVKLKR